MKKLIYSIAVIGFSFSFLSSCSKSDSKKDDPAPAPVYTLTEKTWVRYANSTFYGLTFNSNGTYSITMGGGLSESGKYSNDNSTVTVKASGGMCTYSGQYNFTLTDTTLSLSSVYDSCSIRSNYQLNGQFKKQ